MMERLAEQEIEAAAAEEEKAVKREHERRRAAAIALLNQHNPDWFASEVAKENGVEEPSTSRRSSEDEGGAGRKKTASRLIAGSATGNEKMDAAAAVARQRALAMAILNEHNSDWFGELEPANNAAGSGSRKPSLFRRIGSRRASKSKNAPPPPPAGDSTSHSIGNPNASSQSATPSSTPTPPPRPSTSIARPNIHSESSPSVVMRGSFGRKFGRGVTSAGNTRPRAEPGGEAGSGANSSGRLERHRSSPWFSRTGAQVASPCPVTPADAPGKATAVAAGLGDIGADGSALTPPPFIQPPLMDVLENKAEEPMSIRSMLRFARENLMEENVLFYLEVSSFKTGGGGQSEYLTHMKRIYALYVQPGSAREINISGDIRNSTTASVNSVLRANDNSSISSTTSPSGIASSIYEAAPCESSRPDTDTDKDTDTDTDTDCSEGQDKASDDNKNKKGDEDGQNGDGKGGPAAEEQGVGGQGAPGADKDPDGAAASEAPDVDATEAAAAPEAPGAGAATATTPAAKVHEVGTEGEKQGGSERAEPGLEARLETGVTGIMCIRQGAGSADSAASLTSGSGSPPALPPRLPSRPGIPQGDGAGVPTSDSNVNVNAAESSRREQGEGGEEDRARSASLTPGGVGGAGGAGGAGDAGDAGDAGAGGAVVEEKDVDGCSEDMRDMRDRHDSMGLFNRLNGSINHVYVDGDLDDFDASGEIEDLGLGIGPGGGYGDRTMFDLALLEIFVVLRHEVYPKFVARVMERSRHPASAATATTTTKPDKNTNKSSISGITTSSLESPVPLEPQRVSRLGSDEVSKAVRAELAKCYY